MTTIVWAIIQNPKCAAVLEQHAPPFFASCDVDIGRLVGLRNLTGLLENVCTNKKCAEASTALLPALEKKCAVTLDFGPLVPIELGEFGSAPQCNIKSNGVQCNVQIARDLDAQCPEGMTKCSPEAFKKVWCTDCARKLIQLEPRKNESEKVYNHMKQVCPDGFFSDVKKEESKGEKKAVVEESKQEKQKDKDNASKKSTSLSSILVLALVSFALFC